MKVNVGMIDRVLRIALGVGLLVWFFMEPGSGLWHWAKLIGVVPLITGLVGNCPLYAVLGISTCPMKSA